MVNRSGIWDLRQVGVNEVNQFWKTLYLFQRAVFMGGSGYAAGSTNAATNVDYRNTIDYVTITTDGNATDFGDLTKGKQKNGSAGASTTRAVNMGGVVSDTGGGSNVDNHSNLIDYITLATTGNATDFGDLTVGRASLAGVSNQTRAVAGGGILSGGSRSNTIDYITIASTGNATDFGDRTETSYLLGGNIQSPTRGCFHGGDGSDVTPTIEYITIASVGNATDFGDLTEQHYSGAGCSSNTRGIRNGGHNNSAVVNIIDYITIASTGNATDFGDLRTVLSGHGSTSNHTKGLIAGGNSHAANHEIQKITIASTGNTSDFGDMTVGRFGTTESFAAASGAHGGLG